MSALEFLAALTQVLYVLIFVVSLLRLSLVLTPDGAPS